jgi:4'-phosphopantetheinyl transferase
VSNFSVYIFDMHNKLSEEERLYRAASHYSGLAPDVFCKVKTKGGKPFFQNAPHIKFSISHSGEYWACAFGATEVGFDIQEHKRCRYRDIARRFFNLAETEHLEACGYAPGEFYRIWTAKESYIKFTGRGLSQGLATFSVLSPIEGAQLKHIPFKEGYSMCICAEKIGEVLLNTENLNPADI